MWSLRKYLGRHIRNYSSSIPTIFALSSGQGKCGVAVIRISGPRAREAIFKMTKCIELPKPRMATLHHLKDPETLEDLDKGLVLWFPGPRSFTGEDSCEFQIHGGSAVIQSVLMALAKLPEFKPAEAGDFTKRAFFAGKLDLTEVEGLGDLIHAETELQRRQALYQMEGNLSELYKGWRSILIRNLAHVEAYIDFSEDDNLEDNILQQVSDELRKLQNEMKRHLTDGRKGEILRHGIKTTIIGEPNAGKSSLLNAICQKPAAIVTSIPGTTRDTIQMHININGFPIMLTDTAGLRDNACDIAEKEGIVRARSTIEKADLVLIVIDSCRLIEFSPCFSKLCIEQFINDHIRFLNLNIATEKIGTNCTMPIDSSALPKFIYVFNKIDLLSEEQKLILYKKVEVTYNVSCISCHTEEGFQTFINDVTKALQNMCGNPSRENPSLTQSRHRHHLNESVRFLNEYFTLENVDVTMSAQKLRLSAHNLGKIIGSVTSEEILDIIFKDFCIGK